MRVTTAVGERAIVSFRVRCRAGADRVYLRLAGAGEDPRLIPMDRCGRKRWGADVPLEPGRYRFRYFIQRGATLICQPPDPTPGAGVESLDGSLEVGVRHRSQRRATADA